MIWGMNTRPMSQLGQTRRFGDVRVTSAFPLMADVRQGSASPKSASSDVTACLVVKSPTKCGITTILDPRHDPSHRIPAPPLPNEVDAIEDRLIDHNGHATGRHDSQGLGFVIRDEAGAGVPRDTQFFAAFRHLRVSLPDLQHAVRNRLAVVVEYPPLFVAGPKS